MNRQKSKPGYCHKVICVIAFFASVTIALIALVATCYLCFDDPDHPEPSKEILIKNETLNSIPLRQLSKEIESATNAEMISKQLRKEIESATNAETTPYCVYEEYRNTLLKDEVKHMILWLIAAIKHDVMTTWNDKSQYSQQEDFLHMLRADDMFSKRNKKFDESYRKHSETYKPEQYEIAGISNKVATIEYRYNALYQTFFNLFKIRQREDLDVLFVNLMDGNEYSGRKGLCGGGVPMRLWRSGSIQSIRKKVKEFLTNKLSQESDLNELYSLEEKFNEMMEECNTLSRLIHFLKESKTGLHNDDLENLVRKIDGFNGTVFSPFLQLYIEEVGKQMRAYGQPHVNKFFLKLHHDLHIASNWYQSLK